MMVFRKKNKKKINMLYTFETFDGKVGVMSPNEYNELWCENSNLTKLSIPYNCSNDRIYCWDNKLKELILLNSCIEIWCDGNQLKEFTIPENTKIVYCDMKSVTELNKVNKLNLWI